MKKERKSRYFFVGMEIFCIFARSIGIIPLKEESLDTTFGKRHRCFVFGELKRRKFHCWSRTMLMCRTWIDCIYIRSVRRVVPSSTLLDVYYISVWAFIELFTSKGFPTTSIRKQLVWMPTFFFCGSHKILIVSLGHHQTSYLNNMKNKLVYFLMGLMIISFSACSSDDPLVPNITVPEGVENYFVKNINFDTSAAEQTVTFVTNMDWKINVPQNVNWCKVTPQTGGAGTQNVEISVPNNDTYDDRSAYLKVSVGDSTMRVIVVNQKQLDALTLTADKFEIPQEGGTIDVEVKSNIDFTYSIPDEYKTWIHAASTRGTRALTSHHLTFKVDASEEYEKREGQIIIKGNNKEEVINVYQGGGGLLTLTPNEISVGSEGGTAEIVVNSNFDFDVEMPNVDWLQKVDASMTRAISSHVVRFVVTANKEFEERSTIVRVYDKNSDLSEEVKIIQEKRVAIKFETPDIELIEDSSEKLKYINNMDNKNVTFTSSNPEVAIVSDDGTVKALSKGNATITATSADGKYYDKCEVTVKNIVDYLKTDVKLGSYAIINGLLMYGTELNWTFQNNSNVDVFLKSVLVSADSYVGGKDVGQVVPAGETFKYTTTAGRLGLLPPVICEFNIEYNNKSYVVRETFH